MDWLFIIAQILGIFIFIFDILAIIANKKRKILLYNSIANFISMIQYLCLKAYTGVLSIVISFLRNIVFSKYEKDKKKIPLYWLIILLVLLGISNYTTYDGLISCVPVLSITIYTIALWQRSITKFKLLDTIIGILSAIYDFHYGAYVSFATQIIFIIACSISYVYNVKLEKKKIKKRKGN